MKMIEKQTVKNFLQLAKEIDTYAKEMSLAPQWVGAYNYYTSGAVFFGDSIMVSEALSKDIRFSFFCSGIDSDNFSENLDCLCLNCADSFADFKSKEGKKNSDMAAKKKMEELESLESRIVELKQQLNLE